MGTFYDPMIAKLVVTAEDRPAALQALVEALKDTQVRWSCSARHASYADRGIRTGLHQAIRCGATGQVTKSRVPIPACSRKYWC